MKFTTNDIKVLREKTGAGIVECKNMLTLHNGNMEVSEQALIANLGQKALKKTDRTTNEGVVAHYIHPNKKMGAMISLKCETDFVAKNVLFIQLANDIAMHVAAMDTQDVVALYDEKFVKDASITIKDYIHQVIGKVGENIQVANIVRFTI